MDIGKIRPPDEFSGASKSGGACTGEAGDAPVKYDAVIIGDTPKRSHRAFNLTTVQASLDNIAISSVGPETLAAPPGPVAAALSDQLKTLSEHNARFFKRRGFWIPRIMSRFKEVDCGETERIITAGRERECKRLDARTPDGGIFAVADREDVSLLLTFKDLAGADALANKELADFLNSAEKEGFVFRIPESKKKGGYCLYRYLTRQRGEESDSPTIEIACKGGRILSLGPEDFNNIGKLEQLLDDARTALRELDDSAALVEQVLKPVYDQSIGARIDVMKGIKKHFRFYNNGRSPQDSAISDYEYIRSNSGTGSEFLSLGEMYGRFLGALANDWWSSSCTTGLEFIADALRDRPGDFDVFEQLIKSGVSVEAARKIYEKLPEPRAKDDYKNTASLFMGDNWWYPLAVEGVMTPVGDAPLPDRMAIYRGIGNREQQYINGKYGWEYLKEDYDRLRSSAKSGSEFVTIGKMYSRLLDALGGTAWSTSYKTGLDFILGTLRDRPGDFDVFEQLIKSGVSVEAAQKIYEKLPEPRAKNDYKNTASLFMGDNWWYPLAVEGVMTPVGDAPLPDRVAIYRGIGNHEQENIHEKCGWEYLKEDYDRLRSSAKSGSEFVTIGKMYSRLLDALGGTAWSTSYKTGLEFILGTLRDRPGDFDVFEQLIKSGVSVEAAQKIYEKLPEPRAKDDHKNTASLFMGDNWWYPLAVEGVMTPVGDAPLPDRMAIYRGIGNHEQENIHEKCGWEYLKEDYDRLRSSAKSGSEFVTIGKMYSRLLDAFGRTAWSTSYKTGLEFILGTLRTDVTRFEAYERMIRCGIGMEDGIRVLEKISGQVKNEDQAVRSEIFEKIYDGRQVWYQEKLEEAMKDYDAITGAIDGSESLQDAHKRYHALTEAFKAVKNRELAGSAAVRDTFRWITREKEKETFGEKSLQEVMVTLVESLVLRSTPEEAKNDVIHMCNMHEDGYGEVIADEDREIININGIKLDVRKSGSSHREKRQGK